MKLKRKVTGVDILFHLGWVILIGAAALALYKFHLDRQFYSNMLKSDPKMYARYKELRAAEEKHYGKVITWITNGPAI